MMATGGLMRLSSQVSLDAEYIGDNQNVQKQAVTFPTQEFRDAESDESLVVSSDGSCSSMPSENWEKELEKYLKNPRLMMPKEIKGDFTDCLILYAEEDRKGAEEFRIHLINDIKIKNHGPITAHLYDEFNPSAGSIISQLNDSYERSTFILIYMTQKLFKDKWTKLFSETCLMDSIDNEDKQWCIVPVYPQKKNTSFHVPLFFNHLTGINYYQNNDSYKKYVAKLIEEKVHVRLRKIEKQKQRQKNWLQKYKQDQLKKHHDKTNKKEKRIDRIQQSQADSVIQPSQANGGIQQSQAEGEIQQSQANGRIQQSQAEGGIQQSQADGRIQQSQAEGGIQQSQADGRLQQSQADGMIQQSQADSVIQQSQADGRIQQSQADGMIQQSQADGRIQQSQADGGIQQSQADGRIQQSQAEGGIQQSQADSVIQQSQADGRIQQSQADGGIQQSQADSGIQQSQTDGRLQQSQADGRIQQSQTDGRLQQSQTDGRIQQSQADGRLQQSQAEGRIQQSQADGRLQQSQADGRLQQSQADGMIQQSQADSGIQQSQADGGIQQSEAEGRIHWSQADGWIQQSQSNTVTYNCTVSLEEDGENLYGKPSFPGNQMEQVGQVTVRGQTETVMGTNPKMKSNYSEYRSMYEGKEFGLNRTREKPKTNISQSTCVARVAPMIKNNALESRHGSETKAPIQLGQKKKKSIVSQSRGDVKPSVKKSDNVLTSGADNVLTSGAENQMKSNITLSCPNENSVSDSPTAFDNSSEFKEPQNGQPGWAFSMYGYRNAARLFYYDRRNTAEIPFSDDSCRRKY